MSVVKRNSKIFVALVLTVIITACGAAKLEDKLDLGKKYLEELNYDEAIAAYDAAIEIDSTNIDAYVGKAKAYEGKSTTIDEVEESLDTLFLAYTTLYDMEQATDIEYTGVDESMDSVSKLMSEVESEFTDEICAYMEELQAAEDFETVQKLKEKYAEYFDIDFDSYLIPVEVTVSGICVYIGDSDGQVYYTTDNLSTNGNNSAAWGIYADEPVTMPDGSQQQALVLYGEHNSEIWNEGARVTITGKLHIFDGDETDTPPTPYGIVYDGE